MPPGTGCDSGSLPVPRIAALPSKFPCPGMHADRLREVAVARRIPAPPAGRAAAACGTNSVIERLQSRHRVENSSTSICPPGFNTRCIDASAAALSVTLRRPKPMVTQSKLASAKGSFSAFACT